MRRLLAWPVRRYPLLVAALFGALVATAATAGAAKRITGGQIKDGTIAARDLAPAVRTKLARAGTSAGGSAGGDLAGTYPNPTLQAPTIVALAAQPLPPAPAVDCGAAFATLCGSVAAGDYWSTPPSPTARPGYSVDALGYVHLHGAVTRVGNAVAPIFVLPPGARPAATVRFPATALTGDSIWVAIDSQGQVFAPAFDVSLSGVSFLAGA